MVLRALLVLLLSVAPVFAGLADGKLDIHWIDVEGGGATLIVTPVGESILVDTGNPGGRDTGRIAKHAKEVAKLTKIDHLVITHYHVDHLGGAAELSKLIPIGTVYDNGNHEDRRNETAGKLDEYLAFKADKRVVLNPGDKLLLKPLFTDSAPKQGEPRGPQLAITCLAARQQTIKAQEHHKENTHELAKNLVRRSEDKSDNANSIVLLIKFGDFEFLNCGDLTWNIEEKLVAPRNLVGTVDVYQVNHHGLDASNNPLLIQSVAPTVAVFNNGDKKGCQPLAFLAVKSAPSIKAIYQVHKNLRKDVQNNTADEMIANHSAQNECEGHAMMLHVAADAKSYTVSVPSRKHEKTFETK